MVHTAGMNSPSLNIGLFYPPRLTYRGRMKKISNSRVKTITPEQIKELKLKCRVYEESGPVPVLISIVLPTFNNGNELYTTTLTNIIGEVSKLIDDGVVDELLIVDGSRKKGKPDYEFIKFLLSVCISRCNTFAKEVEFVKSLPEGKQKAMQGRFDFSVRFLSQMDATMQKIFLKHNLLSEDEVWALNKGKGAGLWYSIPVTYGHILCFVDSDIRSFDVSYILSLCKPILDSWKSDRKGGISKPGVVFTKAYYTRKNETEKDFKMGGRLCRMGARPLFSALSKQGVFTGLDKVKYPVSGEFAFAIDQLKGIQFSNGYDIEASMLCQLWKKFGMDKTTQVEFGVYQHIPGSEGHVRDMFKEMSNAILYWASQYEIRGKINEELLEKEFVSEGKELTKEYKKTAKSLEGFGYTIEDKKKDLKRLKSFSSTLKKLLSQPHSSPKLLKAWKDIEIKANQELEYSYQNLKITLRKRINKFTSDVIFSHIFLDKSDEIIKKYTGE